MALAINQGNFARAYNIGTGPQWKVEIKKVLR
jgi:S-adenosylmethionine hydrolase